MIALLLRYWQQIVFALAIGGLVWWISDMRATIAKQAAAIEALDGVLKAERTAREKDVRGLTALTEGLAKVATDNRRDEKALQETINAANPTPVSPALAAFLDRLRRGEAATGADTAAGARR
jgi:uncharacterized coiled-coil protein SlyX